MLCAGRERRGARRALQVVSELVELGIAIKDLELSGAKGES